MKNNIVEPAESCAVCGGVGRKIEAKLGTDLYRCRKCSFYWIDANKLQNNAEEVNYQECLKAIEPLRKENNHIILEKMKEFLPKGSSGLEVGSAVGLFLAAAEDYGYSMLGIEPMEESYQISKNKGLNVVHGLFPMDMPQKKSDFIIFNDVFEHIPEIESVISKLENYLNEKGFVIINLPDSDGVLYKIAMLLSKFGDNSALKRLWQVQTQSPHLYYFNQKSLDQIMSRYGYRRIMPPIAIPSYSKTGIQKRVETMPITKWKAKLYSLGLRWLYPILRRLPSDTKCYIYQIY